MIRRKLLTALTVISLGALGACGGGGDTGTGTGTNGTDAPAAASGGDFMFGAITAPTSYDPSMAEWGNRSIFYQAVYDTLLLATPEGTIEPFLATEYTYNDDNTVLTLKLRDDVTFSSGTKMDSAAVVKTMQRFKDGSGPDKGYMTNVKSIEATDPTTVTVTFSQPDPAFLNYLTRTAGLVADPASLDDPNLATTPVGSGPYTLQQAGTVTGSSYSYTKNPNYWNKDLQHFDNVTVRVFDDPTAALNAVSAGEINAVKIGTNDNLAQIEAAGWKLNTNELDFQGLLLFDRAGTMNKALGDVKVRQALNYAFDRAGLQKALQNGKGSLTTQVFPTSSAAYDKELDNYYTYDPAKAKSLLAEAGYASGFTLAMPRSALLGNATFELVAQQLKEIGVTVEYTDPGQNFIADLLAPKFAASFMALEQNPDWQLIQFMLAPTATFNPFKYEDPKVTAWIKEFQFGDKATQDKVAKEINRYIVEQAWFAPFYRVEGVIGTDPKTTTKMLPSNTLPNLYDFAFTS